MDTTRVRNVAPSQLDTRLSHAQPPPRSTLSLYLSLSLSVSSPRESYCTVYRNHMQEYWAISLVSPRGQLVHKTPTICNNHGRESEARVVGAVATT